jgi:hypothetical protein
MNYGGKSDNKIITINQDIQQKCSLLPLYIHIIRKWHIELNSLIFIEEQVIVPHTDKNLQRMWLSVTRNYVQAQQKYYHQRPKTIWTCNKRTTILPGV